MTINNDFFDLLNTISILTIYLDIGLLVVYYPDAVLDMFDSIKDRFKRIK